MGDQKDSIDVHVTMRFRNGPIARFVESAGGMEAAASRIGVSSHTLRNWISKRPHDGIIQRTNHVPGSSWGGSRSARHGFLPFAMSSRRDHWRKVGSHGSDG